MDLKLTNKVVLITGATGGIGSAIAKAFADEGAKLVLSSTRQEKLDKLIPTLGVDEDRVLGYVMDATQEDEVKGFVDAAVERFGGIDVVVPNAGYEGQYNFVQNIDAQDFEKVYAINVFSPLYLMKYAAPHLIERGAGAIVVLASNGSYTPTAGMSTYVSSKYAVAGLTKSIAQELGPHGIHVNYVCPGAVDTDMMRRIEANTFGDTKTQEEAMEVFASASLDKRYAQPEEVAAAVLYLASEVSRHSMGMALHLDAIVQG